MENYEIYDNQNTQQPVQSSGMATASMIMGIISIVTACCMCGFIFSALGILFALLSKTEDKFQKNAKIGIVTSVIGLLLFFLAIVAIAVLVSIGAASGGRLW